MNLDVHGARIFIGDVDHPILTETIVNMWIVMAVIALFCFWLTRGLKVHGGGKRQMAAEWLVTRCTNLVRQNMGEKFMHMTPFIGALLSLSCFCSLSSLFTLYAPTSDLSVLLGWAMLVFVLITYNKIKAGGILGYIKGFFDPIFVMFPFNVISEVATPFSMAFRHFGNIASGSVITGLIYAALSVFSAKVLGAIPGAVGGLLSQIPILQVGIPAVLSIYFDLFSSALQAFIFCMLTMMYIGSAAEG